MAYYYVKSGGTATADAGRAASQRTGTFAAMGASAYYDHIGDALAASTAPAAGDFICCSSSHDKSHGANETIVIPTGVTIISVDDANAENYSAGARESVSSGSFFIDGANGGVIIYEGMTLRAEDLIDFGTSGCKHIMRGGELAAGYTYQTTTADAISFADDGVVLELHEVVLSGPDVADAHIFHGERGAYIEIYGGSITSNTNKTAFLIKANTNSGHVLRAYGVDLANMASAFNLVDENTAALSDASETSLFNCKMPASWTLGETPASSGTVYNVQNCDDGNDRSISARRDIFGHFLTSPTVYADNADQVESQTMSLEVQTSSSASTQAPFRFKIGSVRADFSASKTVTVELVHDAQGSGTGSRFQNNEAWIEVHRPNSADPGFLIESSGLADSFATPTTNASSAETWTGTSMTSETTEKIEVTTTAGGGTGWADIYICFGVASIGAGDCFVSHDIAVA